MRVRTAILAMISFEQHGSSDLIPVDFRMNASRLIPETRRPPRSGEAHEDPRDASNYLVSTVDLELSHIHVQNATRSSVHEHPAPT